MSEEIVEAKVDDALVKISADIEKVLIDGDLSGLDEKGRVEYYNIVCKSLNLNPLTKPFNYIKLNGKVILYANRSAADQLRLIHNISLVVLSKERIGDIYTITVKATAPNGRTDISTGAVSIKNLRDNDLANAFMKCETKAKRRATLSICGLAMIDESELEIARAKEFIDTPLLDSKENKKQISKNSDFRQILADNGIEKDEFKAFSEFSNIKNQKDVENLLENQEKLQELITKFKGNKDDNNI